MIVDNSRYRAIFTGPLIVAVLMLAIVITQSMLHKGVAATHGDCRELVCDERGVVGYQKGAGGGGAINSAPSCSPFFFEPVPINSASKELLTTIPGVGLKTAEKIRQAIVEHGDINNPAELMRVNGIGAAKMDKMLPHVSFK